MATDCFKDKSRWRTLMFAIAASLLWLGAWTWIRGAFVVWLIMLGVYVLAISASILFVPETRRSPAFDAWQTRFFRTSGWVVLSGLLTIGYLILIGLFLGSF